MRGEERRALQATADALRRETQVIRGDASLLRQQLANRLLHAPGDRAVLSGIAERGTAGIAWLRLCNARRESDLLLAVTSCGQGGVFSAAVDDGRKLVYTGGADGSLVCWDARMVTEIARIRAHESVVRAIGIDAASGEVTTLGREGSARAWTTASLTPLPHVRFDTPEGPPPVEFRLNGRLHQVQQTDDAKTLSVVPEGKNAVYDGTYVAGHTDRLNWWAPAIHKGAPRLLTASDDCSVRVWDPATGDCLAVLVGHSASVAFVAPIPPGFVGDIVSASCDDTLRLWRMARPGELRVAPAGHPRAVCAIVLSGDTKRAATASEDGDAIVWDAGTGSPMWSSGAFRAGIEGLALDTTGELLAIALSDGTGLLWDLARDDEETSGTWSEPVYANGAFVVTAPGERHARLASRKKLLGRREWYVQQEDLSEPWPAFGQALRDEEWVVVGAERFPCSAKVTALASAFDDSMVVAGDAVGNVYVLRHLGAVSR